ncbi:MAG: response regulator [Bacteroidales bacterium]|nr:response regulator [Bacteroidales bacterium]
MNNLRFTTANSIVFFNRCFILLLLLISISKKTSAVESGSIFINYSHAEGLTHKFIYNIIRDSDGFLWIATSSGLGRFDSYSFENYINKKQNSNFLEGVAIYGVAEGKNGRIWLSTDAGVGYFNKIEERFFSVKNVLLKDHVFKKDITVDDKGLVWLFNQNLKFIAYDPQQDSVILHIPDYKTWGVDEAFYIHHFLVVGDDIWIASNQGIATYNYKNKQFSFIHKTTHNHCHTMRRADNNTIVVTYMFDGVYIIDINKKKTQFISKTLIEEKIGANTSLFDAVLEADSTLWVSVSPGMVSIKNDNFQYHCFDSRQNFFSGDVVSCLFRDFENNLWIGTYGDGIFLKKKNNSKFNFFTRLYKNDIKKTHISGLTVFPNNSLLYRDTKGVYICNDYKKLNIDCAKRIFNAPSPNMFPLDNRYALISAVDTFFIFDSQDNSLKRSFIGTAPASAYRDASGIIWIGTWHGYIIGFDAQGNKKIERAIDTAYKTFYAVTSICGEKDGSLWLGTSGLGVIHITNPTQKNATIEYYNKSGKGKYFLNSYTVNSLYIDQSENLWIGTNGAGLIKRDKKTKQIETFTSINGLKSNIIESIIADNDNNIWFSSIMISKYDTKQKVFTHFTNFDGINGNFVAKASCKAPNGDLLFANTEGVFVFNPNEIKEREEASKPLLTSFRIRGSVVNTGDTLDGYVFNSKSITYAEKFSLPYYLNTFAIEFASIYFHESQTINYEYMLEGIDNTWIPADTRTRLASYSGLQAGTYIFKVRASFGAGKWSDVRVLVIKITPPWWKSWWFRIFVISLFSTLSFLFFVLRTRNLKKHNIELEKIVSKRTLELELANKSLQETTKNLDIKNKNLEEHQMVIEMKNKDLHDALNTKDKLITILGHDFKNPLTGLHGIATLLQKESEKATSPKIKKYSDYILSSSTSLMNQMLMLLDWAQSQFHSLQYNPAEVNIGVLLNDAINLLSENARQKQITISTHFEYSTNAFIDSRMVSTVFRNLLGNAIKFTPRGGKIMLMIQEYENGINITFVDTGIGISEEKQAFFKTSSLYFDSTFGTENEKGSGLGLQICKTFIEKNKGTITLTSKVGEGTSFTITLPKGESEIDDQSIEYEDSIEISEINDTLQDSKVSILIIDDDESIVELLKTTFESIHTVITANNGKEGLYIAQNMLPNLIISDIGLPEINGIDICEILKNNEFTCHIPILLITSTVGDEIQNKSFLSGADDFIAKPFNVFALKHKVKSLLEMQEIITTKTKKQLESERVFLLPEDYDNKIIKQTLEFIHNNLSDENLDTNNIADKIGVSRSQLWRIFKNTTGKSLGDVIKDIRMQKAMEMLKTGKYRVSEVAFDVGYSDARYFARCFTKVYGKSPTSFIE